MHKIRLLSNKNNKNYTLLLFWFNKINCNVSKGTSKIDETFAEVVNANTNLKINYK